MKNLFICLTPLQSLIAQSLIRKTVPTPADLLMICYAETDNAKFRHYYQETAQLCQYAQFIRIPQNTWLREITLPFITKNLSKQYDTIYAASIDNPNVQYPLSHLSFKKLETFDDGTANLYPDSILYQNQKYGKKFSNIGDWRRNNVNTLIEKLHKEIKKENPNVEFGISPFGVWRNDSTDPVRGSATKAGVQNYDDLYADILLWMNNHWIDYVAPQIYWNQGFKVAEYNTLVKWWSKYAAETNTDLYIGQAAYKVNEWKNAKELVNQINFNRNYPEVKGRIFFSYKSLLTNPKNATNSLKQGP